MLDKIEMGNTVLPFREQRKVGKSKQNYMAGHASLNFRSANKTEENQDNNKSKFSLKNLSNVLGVAAWLFVLGIGMYKIGFLRPHSAENVAKKAEDVAKIAKKQVKKNKKDDIAELNKLLEGKSAINKFFTKQFYKIGRWTNNVEDKLGKELYNNLTYAFGTLIVMPLVIWTSPFGKKDSSTSDKVYTTLRQPFSVLATFGMQFTFDKLFDKYTPMIIEKNRLESEEVKQGVVNGKVKPSLFDKIRYNYKEVKRLFKEELPNLGQNEGGLRGIITKEQAKQILTLPEGLKDSDVSTVQKHLDLLLKGLKGKQLLNAEELGEFNSRFKLFKDLKLNPEHLSLLEKKLRTIKNACGLNDIAKQRPKVINNVIFSSIIGCTFLNVIYGKTMKAIENHKKGNQSDNNTAKEAK